MTESNINLFKNSLLINFIPFNFKETLPPNKNAAFKGYHLPFIGYTYTENSLINDCQSLYDLIQSNNSHEYAAATSASDNKTTTNEPVKSNKEYECIIAQLETDKLDLTTKLNALQSLKHTNESSNAASAVTELNGDTDSPDITKELAFKLDQSQQALLVCNEQIGQLNVKLNEMTSMYETAKQNEVEEKNKIKHLERSVRALKIEKDQLFTVIKLHFKRLLLLEEKIYFFLRKNIIFQEKVM